MPTSIGSKEALTAYVKARLKKEENEHGRGYRTEVAKRTGLSQGYISNLLNKEYGAVGWDAADALAKFWSVSGAADLTTTALEWAKREMVETPAGPQPRRPNLEAALESASRAHGPLPDAVLDEARELGTAARRDYPMDAWMVLIAAMLREHATETPTPSPARRPRAASGR